ncbi:hypothetical protein ACIOEZ_07620 [Streptomyces sp. NPDC087866]|uniref:hypothetical protein n=1 Tax=unclassified Streptomyces TaxID=2593676 RepID=UPI003653112E
MKPARPPKGRPIPRGPSTTAWQEVLALVGAGKRVSYTCARAAQYYSRPDVVYVPFSDAPEVEYGLLWAATNSTPKVQAFTEILLERAQAASASSPGPSSSEVLSYPQTIAWAHEWGPGSPSGPFLQIIPGSRAPTGRIRGVGEDDGGRDGSAAKGANVACGRVLGRRAAP